MSEAIDILRSLFVDGPVDVALAGNPNQIKLMQARVQAVLAEPPQPSLTPADLIALRDAWRDSATRMAAGKGQRTREQRGHEVLMNCAAELDTLITRLSCPTCGGPCVYQGQHP